MRSAATLLAPMVVLSLLAPSAEAQQTRSGTEPDQDAMKLARELTQSFVAAYNAHDARKLAARYASDADWISYLGEEVGTRLAGREEIERYYRETFTASPKVQVELTPEHARLVTPDFHIGDYTWSISNSTRKDRPSRGRATVVDLRRDGRWQICSARLFMTPPTADGSGRTRLRPGRARTR